MKQNKNTHFMAGIFMVLFIGSFLLITGRFIYIQTVGEVDNVSLQEWAKEKREASDNLQAERGFIFDSNGMTLAYDRPSYRLYAIIDDSFTVTKSNPQHVVDAEEAAEKLAPILDVEESFIVEKLNNGKEKDDFQVEFGKDGKDLDQNTKDEIDELHLPGINFEKEAIRYYPNGTFASHIIGLAQRKTIEADEDEEDKEDDELVKEEIVGVTGIEKEMNDLLSGENGSISYQRDSYNTKLLNPEEIVKNPVDGDDIFLTIDQKVQILLEDTMTEVEESYDPERMTAVVMNAKTGEIVAMSNRPSYNPNSPIDVENWYNDAISTPFEPGSTVKMFTWAAAIDAGVYNGDDTYKSGSYQINESIPNKINDHNNGEGWGTITYDEGFIRSSNVATAKLVWEKLGSETYYDYLQAFGFEEKSGIDLPGEVPGKILYNWPSEKVTTGFGQGSTMTPIQQIKAASAITNNGKMLQPYVIKKILDKGSGDIIEEKEPEVVGEPISEETADQVIDLLDDVVNSKDGTGKPYRLDDYSVIGKTGTAQIPDPSGPTPYLSGHNKNVFSFLGMAPKDDPELIMYVAVNQPNLSDGESGSAPGAFIFKNVMESSLKYLNIEPDMDDTEEVNAIEIPALKDKKVAEVKETLTAEGLKVTVIGSGEKVTEANVGEKDELYINDRVLLITDKPVMPNLKGWSKRDVLELAKLLGLEVEVSGDGYVTSQNIKKDDTFEEGDVLEVELTPPVESDSKEEN